VSKVSGWVCLKLLDFFAGNYRNSLETLTGTVAGTTTGSFKSFETKFFRIEITDIQLPENCSI